MAHSEWQFADAREIPFERLRSWMFDAALPFWATRGCGGPWAFRERCWLDGTPDASAIVRARVIARQVYVFSHACLLERNGSYLEVARAGVDALLSRVWLGADKGWGRLLGPDGSIRDDRPDLYDWAFILFALGWWMRACGNRDVEPYADETLNLIEGVLPHPSGLGHLHILPVESAYQQNPHMHLVEACLVLHLATGNQRWMEKAGTIISLLRSRFLNPRSFDLTEYFDERWSPAPGDLGLVVEPGHQFEWAWILFQYMQQSGCDLECEIRGLVQAAERLGVSSRTRLVYGSVRRGGVIDSRHRIWPQTERIKGNLALFELTGHDRTGPIALATTALLERYLDPAPHGAWIDVLDEDANAIATDIPASTFYHLFLAFAELLRLQPALQAAA